MATKLWSSVQYSGAVVGFQKLHSALVVWDASVQEHDQWLKNSLIFLDGKVTSQNSHLESRQSWIRESNKDAKVSLSSKKSN
jgi:hypothetical protein